MKDGNYLTPKGSARNLFLFKALLVGLIFLSLNSRILLLRDIAHKHVRLFIVGIEFAPLINWLTTSNDAQNGYARRHKRQI